MKVLSIRDPCGYGGSPGSRFLKFQESRECGIHIGDLMAPQNMKAWRHVPILRHATEGLHIGDDEGETGFVAVLSHGGVVIELQHEVVHRLDAL